MNYDCIFIPARIIEISTPLGSKTILAQAFNKQLVARMRKSKEEILTNIPYESINIKTLKEFQSMERAETWIYEQKMDVQRLEERYVQHTPLPMRPGINAKAVVEQTTGRQFSTMGAAAKHFRLPLPTLSWAITHRGGVIKNLRFVKV